MRISKDINGILSTLPSNLQAAVLLIKTKNHKAKLTEEKGRWLQELWEKVRSTHVSECRCSWDEMYFFSVDIENPEFEKNLVSVLRENNHSDLDSYLLFSEITGDTNSKIKSLEEMQLQIHKISYWEKHIFDYYYLNGLKQELSHN